ncbi:protein WEAK CHLOROPLAST MOVEMENT UNDER BLUE LIGHT 1-like isoform X2 [Phragmites australis]|uniref:protein WEAK CHLOROPLAST MOVEMENT UNDER BLUE LIGHT 1-like isoform X2 n=1 Tax=Phragmites australis TaxID=29695 RepID=UPI002D79AD87|nr:protein WEAK CHLOROPLAST MOVEMENT UNDER BLUE LIGHT 1-like isoform X2 [Phragmites australis]
MGRRQLARARASLPTTLSPSLPPLFSTTAKPNQNDSTQQSLSLSSSLLLSLSSTDLLLGEAEEEDEEEYKGLSSSHENSKCGQSQLRMDQHETQEQNGSYKASEIASRFIQVIDPKSQHIDTAAPIDSVKGAVSKFGGILDWRERRKQVQDELDKVQEDVTEYQKISHEAEAGKAQALQELSSTTSVVDELRLSLEKAQTEEAQALQETELAELHLRELQRDASDSAAAKAELHAVRDRRAAALADLQSVRAELESLEKERTAAAAEAGAVMGRAREAAAESQEAGKAIEDLAAELIALKGVLESSHAAHGEAEEKRMILALELEQDKSQWQSELEEAGQEAKKLRDELMAANDLESKAAVASELLASLKAELFACAVEGTLGEEEKPTVSSQAMLEKIKKELEDVKASVERANDEAKCLRVAAASMRVDLEREKAELAALQRKEGLSSASIPSLEEELSRVISELAAAEAGAKEDNDETKMAEQVGEARRETEQAKAKARSVRDEVAKAKEETGVAKAAVAAMEARLEAVMREILAANTSEEIATASASALLQESKTSRKAQSQAVEGGVTLTVEEYEELSRRARETEEVAGKRVIQAVKLIKETKDAEVRSLEKLAQLAKQTEQRRQALQAATVEAEEAEFGKLSAERELRQQRRAAGETDSPRTGLAAISVLDDPGDSNGRGNPHILSPRGYMPRADVMGPAGSEAEARQRKTFFPRMVMFLARKRAQSWK